MSVITENIAIEDIGLDRVIAEVGLLKTIDAIITCADDQKIGS